MEKVRTMRISRAEETSRPPEWRPSAKKYGRYYQPSFWPYYPKIPLFQILRETSSTFPNEPFILHPKKMTFKELDTLSDKLAAALTDLGVKKGNAVGLFMWNSPEFIVSFFGILKAGGVVTALNPSFKKGEAKYQLEDSEAVAVIVEDGCYPVVKGIQGELPRLKNTIVVGEERPKTRSFGELIEGYPPTPPEIEIDPTEDLAVIQYTAGLTNPRGCMLTHFNLVCNVFQVSGSPALELTRSDVVLAHLPFYHIYGMSNLICVSIRMGGKVVIQKRFDIEEFLDLIEKFRVTIVPTVMPVITLLVHYPDLLKKHDLSSLRFISNGGVPINPEIAKKFQELTGVTTINGYGLSETSPVTHVNPLSRIKLESVGPPVPDTEHKIVDVETGTRELPPGEIGEVAVMGPQVMKGYWKRPEETREVLKEGWLFTGDLGKIDKDGYLYIVGRKKEIIKYMGFTIGPGELETLLKGHPAVADCAVIGKPDPVVTEFPKAFIKLKKGVKVNEEEIMEFLRDKVAVYKLVREVEFVKSIPRTPEGKLLRKELIERELRQASPQPSKNPE